MREIVIIHPHHGMKLHEHQFAAGFQEVGNHRRPLVEIGKPSDGSVTGINDVEFAFQHVRKFIYIGNNKFGIGTALRGEIFGSFNGFVGKIDARDFRAQSGKRNGILPEMTLKMKNLFAAEVAKEIQFNGVQGAAAFEKLVHEVEVGFEVRFYFGVPRFAVDFEVVHGEVVV